MFNQEQLYERMTAIKERRKEALADLRYRHSKVKPLKQSEVTKMMRNLVKNQWCAAHNGTITMKAVTAMSKQQLTEEYENICRRLEKDHLLSAQYNLFRPKPALTEPPSKRQRVERASSQPSDVPAATTQPADDPDSAGGSSFHPAGSTPMSGSAVPDTAGGTLGTTGTASTVPTSAAMDSPASHRELGISPFADSDESSSPSPVSTDHIPIDVLFEPTPGGVHAFLLDNDEGEQIGLSRVATEPDSDDEVLAEILFSRVILGGCGVVGEWWGGVVWVGDMVPFDVFLSSENWRVDDDLEIIFPYSVMEHLKIGRFDVHLVVSVPHSMMWKNFGNQEDRCEHWKLNPRALFMSLDLTHGKTVYMFVDKVYPIRATLLERMLRHRLTVPPSYCRNVVVAGSVIQTIQAGLRESYECLASVPIACTARQMVFSSPWLTAKKESGSPLQTALVCNSNPLMVARVDMVINPPWNLPFLGAKGLTSPEQTATGKGISNPLMAVMVCPKPYGIQLTNVSSTEIWKLLLRDVAVSFDSAVHRDHAGSFDAVVPSLVSAVCVAAAAYLVPAALQSSCLKKIYLETWN
ncbi:hypothetical protein Tco_1320942 [Tanacetum coccineum]